MLLLADKLLKLFGRELLQVLLGKVGHVNKVLALRWLQSVELRKLLRVQGHFSIFLLVKLLILFILVLDKGLRIKSGLLLLCILFLLYLPLLMQKHKLLLLGKLREHLHDLLLLKKEFHLLFVKSFASALLLLIRRLGRLYSFLV